LEVCLRNLEQYEREISNRFEASAELGQIRDLLSKFSFAAEEYGK
jgi:hypothetical protein